MISLSSLRQNKKVVKPKRIMLFLTLLVVGGQIAVSQKNDQGDEDDEKIEDYDTWKTRILAEAYELMKDRGYNKQSSAKEQ